MNDVNSLAHTSWNCKYHVVFAPKYRRKVFFGEKRREIGSILRPSRHKTEVEAKKARDQLIGAAEERRVLENLKKYPMDGFSMHRH